MSIYATDKLTRTLTMGPLDVHLRQDISRSLRVAIAAGSVFPCPATPLQIFRSAVSIAVERHSTRIAKLVDDCGANGPQGPEPARAEDQYWAIRFAVFRAVTAIQGSLAEMLA